MTILSWSARPATAQQKPQMADRIVAVVNDHIILKSEVDQRVADYLHGAQQQGAQNITFSKKLWYNALESVIDNYVLLEKAKIDSVTVSDDQVNNAMDNRIDQLVKRAGSENALEKAFGKSLVQIKADFRQRFRQDMIVQQVRQQKMQKITITRPEVKEFFNGIPADSVPTVPERVELSQIVAVPPPLKDAKKAAYELAKKLRDSVTTYHKNFEAMARKYSDGPSATNGGLLPLMPMSDLVPEYSAAASALEPGEISEVVETSYGYHIIRLNRRVGDKIETNHILISVDKSKMDDQKAISELKALRDSVMNHGADFAELARKYSDDEATASMGGKLMDPQTGERLIRINRLDPSLYRITLLLDEEGDISEPKSFTPDQKNAKKAFRIVRLDKRVPEHQANLDKDYEMIKNMALQDKQVKEMQDWLDKLRDQVYVEYKIPVPKKYKSS